MFIRFAIGLLAPMVLVANVVEASTQSTSSEIQPRAVVVSAEHDFGTVEQDAQIRHAFTIRNDGTAPLVISRIDLSQPGMRSAFARTIEPGQAGRVIIDWRFASGLSGDLIGEAVIRANDPARPRLTLTLKGVVRSAIELVPGAATFFSVFRDQSAEQIVTIVNNEPRPLAIDGLRPQGDHFGAELRTVEAGKRYDVVVKVPSGLAAGRYREALHVLTDHPQRKSMSIGVNVFVKNDLYASPESVAFDGVHAKQLRVPELAQLLARSFTVRKRNGEFKITGISTDVEGLNVERSPSGEVASDAFKIVVGLVPEAVGSSLDGTIRITTDDEGFPELLIPVQGTVQ
jgi:hypothetical protein